MSKCESSGCVEVTDFSGNIRLYSSDTGTVMQMTRAEWFAFLDDLAAGKWAHIGSEERVDVVNVLEMLAVLMVGVLLGFWIQNPALADRERAVRQKLADARKMLADAAVKMHIAEGQLRLVQAVRRQTDEILAFASRASELGPAAASREPSPIYESMHGWLASTGALPEVAAPGSEPALKARERFATKPRKVTATPEATAELAEVSS